MSARNLLFVIAACLLYCAVNGCPNYFEHVHNGCYHFSPTKGTYLQGVSYCAERDSKLLSLESSGESAAINVKIHTLRSNYPISYWTSGSHAITGVFTWVASGQSMTYTNWCMGEPNNYDNSESCVHLLYSGSGNTCWNDVSCTASETYYVPTDIHFICETSL